MRKISVFLIALFVSVGLFAQQNIFKVQGFPREDIPAQQQQQAVKQNSLRATTAETFTFDDIAVWAGEGSNRAGLAVQWNDSRETNAMVWGYQWDGTAYGIDMLFAVCKVDPKFHVMADATTSGYGSAIAGVGYDANGDGVFFVRNKVTGELIYPDANGVIPHPTPTYDYDNYEVGDPEDYWASGWNRSYWSYWVKADANANWGYSGVGASGRKLTDGCWDGWNFSLNMGSYAWKPLIAAPAQGYTSGTFFLNVDKQNFNSSISILDNKKNSFTYNIYEDANDNESLPLNTRFAAIWGDKIYFVAGKTATTGGSIVVASDKKLEKIAQINNVDGRSLIVVSQTLAYVGTGNGIYSLDLQTHTLGSLIAGTNGLGETGPMTQSGDYVFAVLQSGGIKVIDTRTHKVVKTFAGRYLSLTQSSDGNVWAISGNKLVEINPQTWLTEEINLPAHCETSISWGDWNAGSFFADVKSNLLYWANTGANGTTVFKYTIGNSASLNYPFFSLPAGYAFDGAGVRLNQITNTLNISAVNKITGTKQVYVVDASNGDLLATLTPTAGYTDAAYILYPDNAPAINNVQGDYTVPVNSPAFAVPLAGAATDKDNIDKNIAVSVSSATPGLISASLSDNTLTITPQADQSGVGKVVISAQSNGKLTTKNINLNITRALESIAFPYTEKTIKRGSKDTLSVICSPDNATQKAVTWSRTAGTAVSVSNGIVTASSVGTATIRATSVDGAFIAECEYTVEDAPLAGISLDKEATTVYLNQRDTLKITYSPEDAYNKAITWTQNPTGVVSTSYNNTTALLILTGLKEGTTTLTGKSSDGSFEVSCNVNVTFNHATGISLDKSELNLTAPNSESLTAIFSPANASNRTIKWTSSDEAIATVSGTSTSTSVKAVGAGTAIITAESTDDPDLKTTATVHVDFIPLTGFSIAKDSLIGVGASFYATATFTPENASDKTITWTSSDATIATASASGTSGYIRGLKKGSVWIYAETNGSFKDSIQVTVDTIHVTGITVTEPKEVWKPVTTSLWMPPFTVYPTNATDKTVTLTMDSSVVRLYSATMQYLKPYAVGDSWVYYTTQDGGYKDSLLVHITEVATSVSVEEERAMIVGDVAALSATVLPENSNPNVTWTSSDKSVASVDENGVVTALKAGMTNIIAASADVTTLKDTCVITVSNQISGSITLNETSKHLWLNDSFQLTPTVLPANTTNKRVMYKSSDYSVAFISSDGLVTAAGVGTADITVIAQDGGSNVVCTVTVGEIDYTAGVFFVNEDWFGHRNGSLNFLTNDGEWVYNAYERENPGKQLGCSSQYGTIYGGQLYIVSKQAKDPGASVQGSRLAVANAETVQSLAELVKIDEAGDNADGRAFLGVDEHKGYISTDNGIWIYDIDNAQITGQLQGTASGSGSYNGQTGTMLRVGDRVFAVNQSGGVMVIDANEDKIQTVIQAPLDGSNQRGYGSIVQSKDGNLWLSVASGVSGFGDAEDYLIKLNPYTLDTVRIALPAGWAVPNSWYAWTADGFCPSKQENKIYWKNSAGWFSSTKIYAYDIDSNQTELVYDLDDYDDGGWGFYGAAFRIDPVSDAIYAFLFRSFGENTYRTVKINPATKDVVTYPMENHYWFPALPVFPDNFAPVVSTGLTDTTVTKPVRIYLGDKATDVDSPEAAIVKSVLPGYDETLISAIVRNDSLLITPLKAGNTPLTVKFNSNGRVVTKDIVVTVDAFTGLNSINAQISVHPNPFAEYLLIQSTTDGKATIYDLSGRPVLITDVNVGSNKINTSALLKGVYMLKIGDKTMKIVK